MSSSSSSKSDPDPSTPTPSLLWPVSPDLSRARNGVLISAAGATLGGGLIGMMKDTGVGTYGVTTGVNTAIVASMWFGVRELLVSPLLLKLRLTSEAQHRYGLILSSKGLRPGTVEDPSWKQMRSDRVLDTALTSLAFFGVMPSVYQEMKTRISMLKPIRNTWRYTLTTSLLASLTSAVVQWSTNELRIHDWKKNRAWDAYGPISDVEILPIRKAQREALVRSVREQERGRGEVHPAVLARERAEELERKRELERLEEEMTPTEKVRRRGSVFSWERFKKEGLPSFEWKSPEEMIVRYRDRLAGWREELEEVRGELAELGVEKSQLGWEEERRLGVGAWEAETKSSWLEGGGAGLRL